MNFDELLGRAAEPALRDLVGGPGVRLLARLSPELIGPDALREVLLGLHARQELLLDPGTRRELLSLLPPAEAVSLAAALDLDGGDPYAELDSLALRRGSAHEAALLAFFELEPLAAAQAPRPPAVVELEPDHALFDHQRLAADRVLGLLAEEPYRVILHMPTGSGKTRTAMHVIARMMSEREPLLAVWLAHSEELCEQAVEELSAAWRALGNRPVPVHRWWGYYNLGEIPADGVIVAGLAKAHAAAQRSVREIGAIAGRVGLIVMDEAHQAIAPSYRRVLEALSEAGEPTPLLGLTATPGRTWDDIEEDERLADFFYRHKVTLEVPGYDSPIDYLVAEGYLAAAEFEPLLYRAGSALEERDRAELSQALEIPQRLIDRLAEDEQRNLLIVDRVERLVRDHDRLLVFAATVGHARLIATVLRARGLHARAVTGETPASERARAIEDYRADTPDPRVLVNYGVLTTGFDAPRTSAAVIARPTLSLVLYSQMVGRATRGPHAGGNATAKVVTVVDSTLPGFASLTEAFNNWEDSW